jgi:hypothetical protein
MLEGLSVCHISTAKPLRRGSGVPLTKKGRKIKANMEAEYGKKKGEDVFYASENKGTIKGVAKGKRHGGKKAKK